MQFISHNPMPHNTDAVPESKHIVSRGDRFARNAHKGYIFWMTGRPGAGKSTLAMRAERELFNRGRSVYVLDGDNMRRGLNSDLGFTPEDRVENIRRASELAALFADAGFIAIAAFISPYARDRALARSRFPQGFDEVYIRCSAAVCEARDPKGHYARARSEHIPNFTGVSAPYEPPEQAELVLDTEHVDMNACLARLVDHIETKVRLDAITGDG